MLIHKIEYIAKYKKIKVVVKLQQQKKKQVLIEY